MKDDYKDKIEGLQQGVKVLSDYIGELEDRIDRALEYINKHWPDWCSDHCTNATNVVNILRGDDNE